MLLIEFSLALLTVNQVMSQTRRGNKASSRASLQSKEMVQLGTVGKSISAPGMPLVNVSLLEQTFIPSRSSTLAPLTEQKVSEDMRLYLLKNTLVTCNDGTTAGYYIRESKASKRWIIFLEGGWCCYSKETCDVRYKNTRRLMSSTDWPKSRRGTGILSPRQDENPHWWNLNAVFVPYCSSDVWSGNISQSRNDYAFMGSAIIQEVIRELVPKGIKQAKSVILAGSSAGGTGVLINIDRVASLVEEMTADTVQVRGLVDSGWFLESKHGKSDCMDGASCALTDAIKKGLKLWNGALPEKCRQQYKKEDEWQCFYGPKSYTSMKTPIFVVQWLYDVEQLRIENIQPDFQFMTANQWNNIQSIGRELKKSLREVPAVFAPACFSHTLITASNWLGFQVKGVTLSRALQCWIKSLQDRKGPKTVMRGCSFHLIDNCQWPHCNPTCPALHDPVTGQEVTLLQMFLRLSIENQRRGQEPKGDMNQLMALLRNGG
ncbi:palmitoleoyl-protein carboxylesterase notum2-like [Hyla sarda]|uniref:palmitoleoyl-protein carboxylesterase notum2-like n=1 Tax=Hyla sarda TaxID=327740 RepID=UPI0024C41387|nr:palmitoleoyl-protein carboxylesterase notum2-like [Hyla sarda]XP_056389901.1 palmitoleoyl-protein carboxylesterase notum2-like [Hyla sarda]XP_056389902.1 palmitoleoyl-protein carboxylesterase notum2-like [Hyla sarda]